MLQALQLPWGCGFIYRSPNLALSLYKMGRRYLLLGQNQTREVNTSLSPFCEGTLHSLPPCG